MEIYGRPKTMYEGFLKRLEDSMIKLDLDEAVKNSEEALKAGVDPMDAVNALTKGIWMVGEKYEKGEYFLSELVMAGETMEAAMKVLNPALKNVAQKKVGKIVLSTVKGDLHDLGKNIAKIVLMSNGFEVFDLGIDVDSEKIVRKVKETGAQIVGLSALLSTTIPYIKNVVDALKEAGVRHKIKVIVGGAALDEKTAESFGADAYAINAIVGTRICKKWVEV